MVGATVVGCGSGSKTAAPSPPTAAPAPPPAASTIRLFSPILQPGSTIPRQFTCSGQNLSPPLSWTGVPPGAAELAIVIRDLDAPGGVFVHWVALGLDPHSTGIAAGAVPPGVRQARNGFGTVGYTGPCPPPGDRAHRYATTVYALGRADGLPNGVDSNTALATINQSSIAQGNLQATFAR